MIASLLMVIFGATVTSIEVKVVDELGNAVPTASVRANWIPEAAKNPWYVPAKVIPQVIPVNAKGEVRLEGRHTGSLLMLEVTAPGFYGLIRRHRINDAPPELRLLARGAPVPARRVQVVFKQLPPVGQEVGFDLERASWLPPLGVGQVEDVRITLLSEGVLLRWPDPETGVHTVPVPGGEGYAAALGLTNPRDSLFELTHPRRAPSEGYARELRLPKPRFEQYIVRLKRGDLWVYAVVSRVTHLSEEGFSLSYILGEPTAGDSIEFMPPTAREVGR